MKRIVIAIFALFVLPLSLNAQDYKHEFSVSYGAYSSSIIYHVFVHEWFYDSDPLRDARNDWALGPVSIEYYRRVSPLWSFGAIGANSDLFYDVYYNGEKRQDVRVYNFTAMAAAKLHWLNGQVFKGGIRRIAQECRTIECFAQFPIIIARDGGYVHPAVLHLC